MPGPIVACSVYTLRTHDRLLFVQVIRSTSFTMHTDLHALTGFTPEHVFNDQGAWVSSVNSNLNSQARTSCYSEQLISVRACSRPLQSSGQTRFRCKDTPYTCCSGTEQANIVLRPPWLTTRPASDIRGTSPQYSFHGRDAWQSADDL